MPSTVYGVVETCFNTHQLRAVSWLCLQFFGQLHTQVTPLEGVTAKSRQQSIEIEPWPFDLSHVSEWIVPSDLSEVCRLLTSLCCDSISCLWSAWASCEIICARHQRMSPMDPRGRISSYCAKQRNNRCCRLPQPGWGNLQSDSPSSIFVHIFPRSPGQQTGERGGQPTADAGLSLLHLCWQRGKTCCLLDQSSGWKQPLVPSGW